MYGWRFRLPWECHTRILAGVNTCENAIRTGGIMTRIPQAKLTGVYGAVITYMSRKMFGKVPESAGVFWHNRKVMNFSFGLGRKSQRWSTCDGSLKTFAHMAVASMVGCGACLDLGYFMARQEGLDLDKAREVPRWRESDVFTPLERDVMEYAEAMTVTPPAVTDELSARLLDALGAAALLELTMFAALANLFTRSNTALGIESEGFAAACGLPPLSTPLSGPLAVPRSGPLAPTATAPTATTTTAAARADGVRSAS
jgi:hypothetical protein